MRVSQGKIVPLRAAQCAAAIEQAVAADGPVLARKTAMRRFRANPRPAAERRRSVALYRQPLFRPIRRIWSGINTPFPQEASAKDLPRNNWYDSPSLTSTSGGSWRPGQSSY